MNNNQKYMREAGICDSVITVLTMFQNNPTDIELLAIKSAVKAVGALAEDVINCEILISKGACEKVIDILIRRTAYKYMGLTCFHTLGVLCRSENGLNRISIKLLEEMDENKAEVIMKTIDIFCEGNFV